MMNNSATVSHKRSFSFICKTGRTMWVSLTNKCLKVFFSHSNQLRSLLFACPLPKYLDINAFRRHKLVNASYFRQNKKKCTVKKRCRGKDQYLFFIFDVHAPRDKRLKIIYKYFFFRFHLWTYKTLVSSITKKKPNPNKFKHLLKQPGLKGILSNNKAATKVYFVFLNTAFKRYVISFLSVSTLSLSRYILFLLWNPFWTKTRIKVISRISVNKYFVWNC